MRLLQLHADFIEYEPIEEELNDAEKDIPKSKIRLESLIVVFVSVEKGDTKRTIEKAIEECWKGPFLSEVTSVDVEWVGDNQEYKDFEIRT